MDEEFVVSARGLHYGYVSPAGRQQVLQGSDCAVRRHELLAISGPSGSGKSTLLRLLSGIQAPDKGEIRLLGQDLAGLDEHARAGLRAQHLGFIFQRFNLLPFLTAQENVELGLKLKPLSRQLRREQACAALDYVGLGHKLTSLPSQLSGGEQQRVAVARAVAAAPALLLCDEPTGSLNEEAANDIFELLQQLAHDHGRAVVLITHNDKLAAQADRRLFLQGGKLLSATPPSAVRGVCHV
ncbi:ABC transporter ATP-binding protein [Duganella rhizosphaerae]|uniref:ABC transporter ATP-binding protein n=1 Tax=Duganella rhizosphaerae TaxID=2885763 RepID=UPI0030E89727